MENEELHKCTIEVLLTNEEFSNLEEYCYLDKITKEQIVKELVRDLIPLLIKQKVETMERRTKQLVEEHAKEQKRLETLRIFYAMAERYHQRKQQDNLQ